MLMFQNHIDSMFILSPIVCRRMGIFGPWFCHKCPLGFFNNNTKFLFSGVTVVNHEDEIVLHLLLNKIIWFFFSFFFFFFFSLVKKYFHFYTLWMCEFTVH